MKWLLPILFIFVLPLAIAAQSDNSSVCPSISVHGPVGLVKPRETATYSVQIDLKGLQLNPQYSWSANAGQILTGQGTTSIDVKQPEKANLTVSVEVLGLPNGCPNTASETSDALPQPEAVKLDEFVGPISQVDKSRFDRITEIIRKNPNGELVIFVGNQKKTGSERSSRRQEIIGNLDLFRDEDRRITFVDVGDNREIVQFWLVPPGAKDPVCDECSESTCPTISLSGPEVIKRLGEEIDVKAVVSPNNLTGLAYSWSVNKGKIAKGLDSQEITIDTSDIKIGFNQGGTEIEVKLEIGGFPTGCKSEATDKYGVFIIADFFPIDEYRTTTFSNEEKARLDNLAIQLSHNPNMKAYIVKGFKAGTPKRSISRNIEKVKSFLFVARKFPNDRFVIMIDPAQEQSTKLWLWPTNENFPCDGCLKVY